ncbi:MAG: OmpA family protein, partial [Polyangiales bacterium]
MRRILVGPESDRIEAVESALADPEIHGEAVARVLPRAMALRSHDAELAIAAEPMVTHAVREVVRKDPEQFADALFPVVGRAVRKAVAAAFAAIMERVSNVMEYTFSVQGLRWRLEAARSGRPLAEVVLSHTLLFRVEHVFLLHRPTGLLLASATAAPSEVQEDPEAVAAMLSAIDGFVRESFAEREPLTKFEVGDLAGRIEYGPSAMLVALVRGTPPIELDRALRKALERIQLDHRSRLSGFRGGDTSVFADTQVVLDACLLAKQRERKRGAAPKIVLAVVLLALVGTASAWAWSVHQARLRLNRYVDAFAAEPGFVVTGASREGGRAVVSGLRDPIARDPNAVLSAHGLDGSGVTLRFQPFSSADPALIARKLAPPETIALVVSGGEVRASGVAPREWLQRARLAPGLLPGVTKIDLRDAHEQEAVTAVDEAVRATDGATFSFARGSSAIAVAGASRLDAVAESLKRLSQNAAAAGMKPTVVIEGHADTGGTEPANAALSVSRPAKVKSELEKRGV